MLYLGCPVWSLKGWVGTFYPKGTKPAGFLREYARRLNAVEGNTTFYAVPASKTLQGWLEQMPETFRFCAKIPKAISHNSSLADVADRALQFVEVMRPLASRLGPMFLQLPPGYSPRRIDDLAFFLSAWPREIRLAVEVRHLDWFKDEQREALNQLLTSHDAARVMIDTRPIRETSHDNRLDADVLRALLEAREKKPKVPIRAEQTADFVFLRYIGHPLVQANQVWVEAWAEWIAKQVSAGREAFIFCHSSDDLNAPFICREFHGRVASRVQIPPLPLWDSSAPEQPGLF